MAPSMPIPPRVKMFGRSPVTDEDSGSSRVACVGPFVPASGRCVVLSPTADPDIRQRALSADHGMDSLSWTPSRGAPAVRDVCPGPDRPPRFRLTARSNWIGDGARAAPVGHRPQEIRRLAEPWTVDTGGLGIDQWSPRRPWRRSDMHRLVISGPYQAAHVGCGHHPELRLWADARFGHGPRLVPRTLTWPRYLFENDAFSWLVESRLSESNRRPVHYE